MNTIRKEKITMTKQEVLQMLSSLSQEILYEDKYSIEIESIYEGEDITFHFDSEGKLVAIG